MARTLSEEEWRQAAEAINRVASDETDPCSVCGSQNLLLPTIVDLEGGQDFGGQRMSIPVLTTICDKCGYVRQFSSHALGISEKNDG